jgi:hypothetical protein
VVISFVTCDICVHQFSCTCPNYFINAVICTHIHLVVLQNSVNNNVNISSSLHYNNSLAKDPVVINEVEEASAINECLSFFNATNSQNVSRCDRKDRILKEISNFQILVNNYNFHNVSVVSVSK